MNNSQTHAFTLVELLITITILALIAVVAFTSYGVKQNNVINSKVTTEIDTLTNALLLAQQETGELPLPKGNLNFFAEDTSYVHSYSGSETFAAHGFITHDTLPKKYIDLLPVDPRTGAFYAYGKTKGTGAINEMYEIAGVVWKNDSPVSYVTGDYTAESGPFNLIRSYNGPDFVQDTSESNFPYNPFERILTAKIDDYSGTVTINGNNSYTSNQIINYELKTGDTIEVSTNGSVELYFSDGSRSVLGDTTQKTKLTLQKMDYKQEDNLVTDIKLILEAGMIWNKAASLDEQSEFEIYTTDSTAAVRGTVFGIQKNGPNSQIIVKQGAVAIRQNNIHTDTAGGTTAITKIDILKEYLNIDNTNEANGSADDINGFYSQPLYYDNTRTIAGLTYPEPNDLEGESILEVHEGEPAAGIEMGSYELFENLDAINEIPEIIKDDIIYNVPKFNNNIDIKLIGYSYSGDTLNIKIEIPKKVFTYADDIIINNTYVIGSENWKENYIINDDKVIVTLTGNSLVSYDDILEDDVMAPVDVVTSETFPNSINLIDIISNNNIKNLEILFAKKTSDNKYHETRAVKIALVNDKIFGTKDVEEARIQEIQKIDSLTKISIDDRVICSSENGDLEYTDSTGEQCEPVGKILSNEGWKLAAYASYNHNRSLYTHEGDIIKEYYEHNDTEIMYEFSSIDDSNKGIYADTSKKFKYYYEGNLSQLNINEGNDVIFEMTVNNLNRNDDKYQIFDNNLIFLSLDQGKLKLQDSYYPINITDNFFHNIKIVYNKNISGNSLKLYLDGILLKTEGGNNVVLYFNDTVIGNTNIHIGSKSDYSEKYKGIIDNFKIYKK